MTRSGAPVQGACGDGKTVISAAQPSDAAAAGDTAIENRKNTPAVSRDAVAAAVKWRPGNIWL
jgi:hypothetical protein